VENTVAANQLELAIHPSTTDDSTDPPDPFRSGEARGRSRSSSIGNHSGRSSRASSEERVVNLSMNFGAEADIREAPFPPAPLGVAGSTPNKQQESVGVSREQLLLARLASLTGYTSNALLHELMMDPQFNIPSTQLPTTIVESDVYSNESLTSSEMSRLMADNPGDPSNALKKHMLKIMGDRMISSMILSPFSSPAEVN
jgi:hypothetical protein